MIKRLPEIGPLIEKARFWKICNASGQISKIMEQVQITADGVRDPKGVVFECLSDVTKEFVRGARKRHNEKKSKLYKQVLSDDNATVRYNLMLQSSLYADKLSEEDKAVFAEETDWQNAQKDDVFKWIKQVFGAIR